MASRGALGGLAHATLEMALLLDASGRDLVLIETVGAGQDEVEIARLADITAVVLVPGLGDDVQAMKAGMMEIADVFAINKADLPGAERLEQEIRATQTAAPIRQVIATEGTGCAELFQTIRDVFDKRGHQSARAEIWAVRLQRMLCEDLMERMPQEMLNSHAERVAAKLEDPYTAASALRTSLLGRDP
jgi:LAO/AO transport system kinase